MQPPPKGGFRPAPHLRQRKNATAITSSSNNSSSNATTATTAPPPTKIAKAMLAASFDDGTGVDLLGWTSQSREELAKQAREEALARQAVERERREREEAAAAELQRQKEELEAQERARIEQRRAAKKQRKLEAKRRKAAERAPDTKPLFPVRRGRCC